MNVRTIMLRARRTNVPPVPATLIELSQYLLEYGPTRQIFKGQIIAGDGSTGIIFMHDAMIEPLSRCTQLFCDGTFKVFTNYGSLKSIR